MFTPSKYQAAFFDALLSGPGDIQLVAVAGSGKTKSIEEAAKRLPAAVRQRTLMTAFNKHIERELSDRQRRGDIPQGITISTIHGLGYKVCRRAFEPADARSWVDEKKYSKLTEIHWLQLNLPPSAWEDESTREAVRATEELVRFAMLTLTPETDRAALLEMAAHFGVDIPGGKEDVVLDAIPRILTWGREGLPFRDRDGLTYHPKERISFDDMVYLPNALRLPVPAFDLCFIDECQDFNRAQQELLLKARGNGRAVWVGDPQQSIYGFTGADAESFERIAGRTGARRLPLSICYRCSRAVVERAKIMVPQIEAAPDAIPGAVVELGEDELIELVYNHYQNPRTRSEPFMVLCRVNAPLIKTAFDLIARGVPAKVKGRDIGAQMIKTIDVIAKAVKGFDRKTNEPQPYPFDEFGDACEAYRQHQAAILSGKKNTEMQIASLYDRVDSILAVWSAAMQRGTKDIASMRAYVEELFSNEDQAITLSSIHKAKGLEARKVGILRADLLPHPMARQAWQLDQERNLAYVAVTRAREELYISTPTAGHANAGPAHE